MQRQESTGYQHDVFISYRRVNDWEMFVGRHFMPMFRLWLDTALGRTSDIFVDQEAIRSGEAWPHRLANGVARSKVMVCLWTLQYFSSPWCVTELAMMMARKRVLEASYGPLPLIIAAPIHDTEKPDDCLADIHKFGLQKWANPWLAVGSVNRERLAIEIRRLAEDVAYALTQVPAYDPMWRDLATDEFMRLLKHHESQRLPPNLGQTV